MTSSSSDVVVTSSAKKPRCSRQQSQRFVSTELRHELRLRLRSRFRAFSLFPFPCGSSLLGFSKQKKATSTLSLRLHIHSTHAHQANLGSCLTLRPLLFAVVFVCTFILSLLRRILLTHHQLLLPCSIDPFFEGRMSPATFIMYCIRAQAIC